MKVFVAVLLCLVALFQLPEPVSAQQPICDFCQFAVKFIEGILNLPVAYAELLSQGSDLFAQTQATSPKTLLKNKSSRPWMLFAF